MNPLNHKRYFCVNTNVICGAQTITHVKTFGERLLEARLEAKLTQAQLAARCGYSGQGAIGNLEKRQTTSARHVAALAKALGVNALWLEKNEGPKRNGSATPAEAIREEAALDGYALIEQGLRALVVVGKAKDAILIQAREAAEESRQYREIAMAEFTRAKVKKPGN